MNCWRNDQHSTKIIVLKQHQLKLCSKDGESLFSVSEDRFYDKKLGQDPWRTYDKRTGQEDPWNFDKKTGQNPWDYQEKKQLLILKCVAGSPPPHVSSTI